MNNSQLLNGYKQTEVGVIPEDWDVKPLCKMAEIRSGIAKNSNVSVNDPILVHYLRVANVQDGFLDLTEMSKIEVSRNDLKRYTVLPGDVLMNEGGDLDKLGRGSIWRGEFNPCVHQNHVFIVRSRSSLSSEFLNVWTSGAVARRYFLIAGKQTTNLATINKTALGQLPVVLPSLPEQRSLAATLSDMDALLAGLDKLIAKKRDLKQAAMQQLLTGKIRLPGFDGKWVVKQLEESCELITKGTTPTSIGRKFTNSGVNFLKAESIAENGEPLLGKAAFIDKSTDRLLERSQLKEGDLLISIAGVLGRVGRVSQDILPANTNQALAIVRIGTSSEFQQGFLFYYLRSSITIKQIKDVNVQGAQANISLQNVRDLEIHMPPKISEQTAIATILSDMDSEIAAIEQRRHKTRNLKQAMMQELLTGRIRLL
jgi:type I restriction enzyme, S subunit